MRKVKFNWKDDRMTILWPNHPLVMAGNNVLESVVESLEEGISIGAISSKLSNQLDIPLEEVNSYVQSVYNALSLSGILEGESKKDGKENSSLDINDSLSMATLNITKNCNLNCKHCYAGDRKLNKRKEMTTEEIRNAVIQLGLNINRDPKLFIISGGEPTLESEKLKVAVLTAHDRGLNIRLNTNGYYIDSDLAKFLSNHNVLVQVSMDGSNSKTNALLRGKKEAFNISIGAIKTLVKANCRTRISCTIHSENIQELPEMINLAQDLGVEQFITSGLVVIGNAIHNNVKPVEFKDEFIALYDIVRSSKEKQLMTKSTLLAETINAIRAGIRFTYCGTGSCTCCIDSDGSVYPCINMIRDEYSIGSIITTKFSSLWVNSQKVNKLRNLNVDTMNKRCSACIIRYFCGGYCRGETLEAGGSIKAPYVRCNSWKKGVLQILDFLSETPDIYNLNSDPYKNILHRE